MNQEKNDLLLDIKNLQVSFKIGKKKVIKIVRGVDLKIKRKQIIGLVGESGSGKSVTSKSLLSINEFDITEAEKMMLYSKKSIDNDEIETVDLLKLKRNEWIKIRGKKIGYIPQDPLTSLNPTRTIKKQLLDVLKNDPRFSSKAEKISYLIDLLEKFGIRNAKEKINHYPHTFSGGMKQRVVIAMVVAARPDLIIADEPTTALDPTVQASVLALFEEIRTNYNISIIFISHNISVIAKFCDYIYVMYAGKVVERGTKIDIFTNPLHPYTWALITSIPEDKNEKLYSIPGTPPDMANLGVGDPFATRNQYAMEIDFKKEPSLIKVSETHSAATWLLDPRAPKVELSEQLKKRIQFFRKVFNIND
ncbi:ABC transporter ATP-binding protein [Mesomycoplasma moatsii]|uniref:ABC transporter ATP-binding protein n=1 Tax=Mesomycoplasma moatsii TaxID=171287 RepID=UPI0003B5160B